MSQREIIFGLGGLFLGFALLLVTIWIGQRLAEWRLKKLERRARPAIVIAPPPPSWITDESEVRLWHNSYAYSRCLGYTIDQSAADATETVRRRRLPYHPTNSNYKLGT